MNVHDSQKVANRKTGTFFSEGAQIGVSIEDLLASE